MRTHFDKEAYRRAHKQWMRDTGQSFSSLSKDIIKCILKLQDVKDKLGLQSLKF